MNEEKLKKALIELTKGGATVDIRIKSAQGASYEMVFTQISNNGPQYHPFAVSGSIGTIMDIIFNLDAYAEKFNRKMDGSLHVEEGAEITPKVERKSRKSTEAPANTEPVEKAPVETKPEETKTEESKEVEKKVETPPQVESKREEFIRELQEDEEENEKKKIKPSINMGITENIFNVDDKEDEGEEESVTEKFMSLCDSMIMEVRSVAPDWKLVKKEFEEAKSLFNSFNPTQAESYRSMLKETARIVTQEHKKWSEQYQNVK